MVLFTFELLGLTELWRLDLEDDLRRNRGLRLGLTSSCVVAARIRVVGLGTRDVRRGLAVEGPGPGSDLLVRFGG